MATFNISWSNSALLPNTNVTGQRIDYRQRTVGGSYITTGFTPPNDLAKTVTSASITTLANNVVYQFRVAALCTSGGPSYNTNGIKEGIKFLCEGVVETHTDTTITATINGLPIDIIKVTFTLAGVSFTGVPSGGSMSHTFTGLTPSTTYTLTSEIAAIIDTVETFSNFAATSACQNIINTAAAASCSAPTNLAVVSSNT